MFRIKQILYLAGPVVIFPIVFLSDVIRTTIDLDVSNMSYMRELSVALAFFLIYLWIQQRRQPLRNAPKEMGRLIIVGIGANIVFGIGALLQKSTSFDSSAHALKQSAAGIFGATVTGIALGIVSILLLLFLRDLILFRRRKATRRNYLIYIIILLVASISELRDISGGNSTLSILLSIGAMITIIINSFRQNWIVYLSKREKIYTIVYSILLMFIFVMINVFLSQQFMISKALLAYSMPLHRFIQINAMFASVYFGVTFATTLFHLPTAEVFERKQSELNSLHNLSRLVTQVFDFNELVTTVTQMTTEVCEANSVWLELINEQQEGVEDTFRVVAKRNITQNEIDFLSQEKNSPIRKLVNASQKAVLIDDIWTDRRTKHLKKNGIPRMSILCIPLLSHGKLIGVLHATKNVVNGFEQDDIDVLTTFADHVSLAIENSQLITKSIERERLHQEMMVAQQMQRRLFPQRMPEFAEVEFAAISESSTEVGGDYYDFVSLPDQRIGIIIGDVAGKGVSAAFYMAEVKGIFLSLSSLCRTPKEFLVRANNALLESLEKNSFVSIEYAILDITQQQLVIARAGHCPAIFISQGNTELIRPNGLGLGLTGKDLFEQSTEERTINLHQGDICIFYTDGVSEARNVLGEEFGTERLLELTVKCKDCTAEQMKNRILTAVRTFMGDSAYKDDITLIVLKWKGTAIQ